MVGYLFDCLDDKSRLVGEVEGALLCYNRGIVQQNRVYLWSSLSLSLSITIKVTTAAAYEGQEPAKQPRMSVKGAPARLPSSPGEIRSNNSRCVLGFNESSPTPTCPKVSMNAKTHSAASSLRSLLCYEVLCFAYNNHLCSLVALIPVRQWSTMHLLLGAKDKRNTHSKRKLSSYENFCMIAAVK